ncbi:hypothetical protein RSOL_257910 [Rhizoctonia solani AG-3 Rhs1AP]|uniref:Uncharacterized protein n=1 Tax=Rhizoctonia solani AG-3 Rhs1AP TaxID=1086054 RepID=A0A0A1UJ86_9AGAM|nr:hypothetical protein RSOL_257910 [Rhizoctonia solani AG-3 Rhs1AP]
MVSSHFNSKPPRHNFWARIPWYMLVRGWAKPPLQLGHMYWMK